EFLGQTDRPEAAAKRLERLRRRWEGRTAAAQRDLAKHRARLDAEQAALDERFAAAERLAEALARQAGEAAGDRAEAESLRRRHEEHQQQLETVQATWDQLRRLYEQQLSQQRDEIERLARLLIDDDPKEELSSAA